MPNSLVGMFGRERYTAALPLITEYQMSRADPIPTIPRNGLILTQGYDNQYRISSIIIGSILNLTIGYDANGNIISVLDVVNPPSGEVLETPGTYTYQTGTNKLTHIEGTPVSDFDYDPNGNTTSDNTRTFVYDLSNQLIQIWDGSTQTAGYTYNGAGQRIKKVTQTETRIFHYDLRGHLIAETDQSGQMLGEYIYLGDRLLTMIRPGEMVYYFHNDHLGTPQVLIDDSQAIVWKAVYTPFGKAVPSIQTVENPFRFPGQYYDQETGLHYNYFRYYNPQTGRYVTPDPIGLEGGINLFVYVSNDPISLDDPEGLAAGFCKRKPFVKDKNKKGKRYIPGAAHCYLVANGTIFSWHTEQGGGVTSDEYPESNDCMDLHCHTGDTECVDPEKDKELEDCIYQSGLSLKGNPGSLWLPPVWDCCDVLKTVVRNCGARVGCKNK